MKETFQYSVQLWERYWGTGLFPLLLLIAVVWLLIFRRKEKMTKYLLTYTAVALFVFFCPLTAKFIADKFIGKQVYWRVLWIFPTVPVLGYAATEFLRQRKGFLRPVLVIACIVAVGFCGTDYYTSGWYETVNNNQQVPDEVAGLCELVAGDRGDGEVYLAAEDYICTYVRVYDASIKMPFGRDRRGLKTTKLYTLYELLNTDASNYEDIGAEAKKAGVNYLVVRLPDEAGKQALGKSGYEEVGIVDTYALYRAEL